MARRVSQNDPALDIEFFNSGFYTHRSQLFAPFKNIGINVVSFHEPVIDGNNMENTDLYEWQRRAGFAIFCPTPLGDTEVVNEFYSYRNLNGTVVPLFDSTIRLASFSSSGITPIVAKSVPNQGYITAVGNMMYFSDGAAADYFKQDGTNLSAWGLAAPTVAPIASGLGFWQANTSFGFGQSLLDSNGNIESLSSISIANGTFSNTPTYFAVLPLLGSGEVNWDFAPPYNNLSNVPGTYPGFAVSTVGPGYNNYVFLGGFNFNIPTGAIIVGIMVTLYHESVSGNGRNWVITDESMKLVIGGAVVGTEHASVTQWVNNTVTKVTYGSPTDTWGLSPTAAQVNANGASGFGFALSVNAGSGSGIPNTVLVGTTAANAKPVITIYYQPTSIVAPSAPGLSGQFEPVWPTTIGTTTQDGSVVWTNYGPVLSWYPVTFYPPPVVILDPNGNLQLGSSASNTVAEWNVGTGYATGAVVTYGGLYWVSVLATTNTGVPPSANYNTYSTTGGTTTVTPYWVQTANPIATGTLTPVWNTNIGGLTADGNYTWENIGQGTGIAFTTYEYVYGFRTIYGHLTTASPFSNVTGPILGPLNGAISGFSITSNVLTFTGNNNFIVGNMFQVSGLTTPVGVTLNEQVFTVTAAIPSSTFPLTSVAVNGSNVLTILAINNLVVGQQVLFTGVGTATFLNGQTVTVLASGLSGTQFKANFTHASYGPTTDFGTVSALGSFSTSFTHADVGATTDSGEAFPLIASIMGVGTASPLCNSVATITQVAVTGDIVTLTAVNNFQPGIWVTISGLTGGSFLNGQQAQVIAVDQPVGTPNTYFQIYFVTPNYAPVADSGTATFNAVEIYRTSDGGGTYLFDGAVTNPGANLNWTFNDFVPDENLDAELIAALSHQNDPPPGAPGSVITAKAGTITAYWQGRLWMAVGNYVYFDAGPDCQNGVPEESWPPSYRFQFAGPVLGLIPTPDGVGLLVYLADRINAILGGPETISFYPTDFLTNFGISSPNSLFRDGSTIGQFTTQKQYIELFGTNKADIGEHIGDYLSANFNAAKTYVTSHRNGLDVGIFISNGVDRIVRYGSNVPSWSVPAFPSFGAGALRSIETSAGIYTLMAASPTGGVTGFIGPLNAASGVTIAGSNTAWINPNNITVGNPTTYATVTLPSLSPVAFVQGNNNAVSGSGTGSTTPPFTVNFISGNTAGNFILAYVGIQVGFGSGAFDPHTTVAIADTQGNIYTPVNTRLFSIFTPNIAFASTLYVAQNIKGGANGVTITTSAAPSSPANNGVGVSLSIMEYSGSATIIPISSSTSFDVSGATALPLTLTTNQPNQIVLLASYDGPPAPAGFTRRNTQWAEKVIASPITATYTLTTAGTSGQAFGLVLVNALSQAASLSQILRASAYPLSTLPTTAVVQGIQVALTGKQSEASGDLTITIVPTKGGTSHTFAFGTSNSTVSFGGATDLWNISGAGVPTNLANGALSFDITASLAGSSVSPEVFLSEVQVTLTYQNPGNYLYARDLSSWGDGGTYGQNNGQPYTTCNVTIGSITLSQIGAPLFPLQHIVGYFDAVGNLGGINDATTGSSVPDIWILPNEVNDKAGIGFVYLPEVQQEPPQGQNHPSVTIQALRYPVNMANSYLTSQFIRHLQVKIQFEPENAPNTLKGLAFKEQQD